MACYAQAKTLETCKQGQLAPLPWLHLKVYHALPVNATIILEKILQILRYPTVFVAGVDGGLSCVADGGIVWPQGEGVASPWGGDQAGLFCHVAEQEGDNLPPGAVGGGAEAVGAIAVGDAVGYGPGDGVGVVGAGGHVAKGAAAGDVGGTGEAVEEGHGLGAGHDGGGVEDAGTGAGGDALLGGPEDCVVVVGIRGDVGEAPAAAGGRGTGGTPEEGYHFGPGAGGVGAELAAAGAGGDAFGDSPGDSVRIVRVGGDVGEAGGCGWRISIFGLIVEIYCKGFQCAWERREGSSGS